jgi:hypothetical protein
VWDNPTHNRKETMQHHEIIQVLQDNDTFLITYYAKKYQAIITRRGTWTKPNTNTKGKQLDRQEWKRKDEWQKRHGYRNIK